MARISTRNLIDGGERTTPRTSTPAKSSFVDPQDVRDPVTGLTPAQVAAQKALSQAVTAGAALGIKTTSNVATPGNVPTVTVTKVPTVVTMPTLAPSPTLSTGPTGGGRRVVSTYTDEVTGDVIAVYNDGTTAVISKGNRQAMAALAAQQQAAAEAARKKEAGQSAFDLLRNTFAQYGLENLVFDVEKYIKDGLSPAEFTLRLRTESESYKKRFAANQTRINKGLRALSEAEYIGLEDQYQNIMRRYGLPENYYVRGAMGIQPGFEKFIGGDVSPVELEDRIQLAQNRVINAAPEVASSLRSFYPDITNGDILAYALDPDKALEGIRRKVTAAEIGGAATMAGLATGVSRAEELARFGVTGETARQGFQNIAEILPRGSQLAEIYKQSPYTQATAEQEVFGITGAAEAAQKRRRLQQLETATFSGSSGAAGGALGRERAGAF
jgi:hypothetical protein